MLSKKNRLSRRECESLLRDKTKIFHTPSLFIRAAHKNEFKAAVAVSKKVFKKAVERNRMRRVIYSAFNTYLDIPVHILVSAKKGIKDIQPEKIREEIKGLEKELRRSFLETTPEVL